MFLVLGPRACPLVQSNGKYRVRNDLIRYLTVQRVKECVAGNDSLKQFSDWQAVFVSLFYSYLSEAERRVA